MMIADLFFASRPQNSVQFDDAKFRASEAQLRYARMANAGWDEVHSYEFSWSESPGSTTTVRGGPYRTREECVAAKMAALDAMGYKPPQWWQYWRWGEYRPSA